METVFLGEDGAGGDLAEEKDEEIDPLDAFMMEVQQVSSYLLFIIPYVLVFNCDLILNDSVDTYNNNIA